VGRRKEEVSDLLVDVGSDAIKNYIRRIPWGSYLKAGGEDRENKPNQLLEIPQRPLIDGWLLIGRPGTKGILGGSLCVY